MITRLTQVVQVDLMVDSDGATEFVVRLEGQAFVVYSWEQVVTMLANCREPLITDAELERPPRLYKE